MTTAANTTSQAKAPAANQSDKIQIFMRKQWAVIKYAFSIERALIHLVIAALLFGFALFIKTGGYVAGHNQIYAGLLFIAAGIQIFRACKHSLTPVALLLLVGFGGQYLLGCHVDVYLAKTDLQMIAGAGIVGLLVCSFYRLR